MLSRLLLTALSLRHSSTMTIPDPMRHYLQKKLAATMSSPPAEAAVVAPLVDALVAAAPADEAEDGASWVHHHFDLALRAVEKEPTVATALAAGLPFLEK